MQGRRLDECRVSQRSACECVKRNTAALQKNGQCDNEQPQLKAVEYRGFLVYNHSSDLSEGILQECEAFFFTKEKVQREIYETKQGADHGFKFMERDHVS